MTFRSTLARCLFAVALLFGAGVPSIHADLPRPDPRPQPNPPQPQPPQPNPPPAPTPDEGESQLRPVVIATAASLGVTLLGVWVIRGQLRRRNSVGQPA